MKTATTTAVMIIAHHNVTTAPTPQTMTLITTKASELTPTANTVPPMGTKAKKPGLRRLHEKSQRRLHLYNANKNAVYNDEIVKEDVKDDKTKIKVIKASTMPPMR